MGLNIVIKQRALDVGFDLAGIAPLGVWKDLEFSRQWVEQGRGGEMSYLKNPKRHDPRRILPSAKSVVCVGLIYHTPFPYSTEVAQGESRSQQSVVSGTGQRRTDDEPLPLSNFQFPVSDGCGDREDGAPDSRAWISRYAWGEDYHEVMRAKLERLRAAVEELAPGVETRVYVDTGPIVERAFARFSGIGWMGRNTCIINEQKGSWFFLGVILTSLELEPDLPAPDRCGSCTACLEACPTGALVEPYVMDASRCISYLTIELKGSIPEEFRPKIGANMFGCDICQDVCPWNGKNRSQESVRQPTDRSQHQGFQPLAVRPQPSAVSEPDTRRPAPGTFSLFNPPLEALATITEEDFRRLFCHSPIKRARYRGWLRNLCVAMGNSGDARFLPKLQELVEHDDPIVREHAAWAMTRLSNP